MLHAKQGKSNSFLGFSLDACTFDSWASLILWDFMCKSAPRFLLMSGLWAWPIPPTLAPRIGAMFYSSQQSSSFILSSQVRLFITEPTHTSEVLMPTCASKASTPTFFNFALPLNFFLILF